MSKNRRKTEATRPTRGGGFAWTGATDADGIPVELSNHDIERMDRASIDEYRERRDNVIAARAQRAREADDIERYTEAFVAAGGDRSDARAAWQAKNRAAAAEAANRAEAETLRVSRRRVADAL